MSFAPSIPVAILDTILGRLALLFLTGAGDDHTAARLAASQMLAAYHPETQDELRLAAEIISFSFHALEALSHASGADMTLTHKLRLRGSAVSLSRESHKSQRQLDKLQKARRGEITAQLAEPAAGQLEPIRPRIDNAITVIEAIPQAPASAGKIDAKTWTQAYQQRQTAKRIANNLKKNQARAALQLNPAAALTVAQSR